MVRKRPQAGTTHNRIHACLPASQFWQRKEREEGSVGFERVRHGKQCIPISSLLVAIGSLWLLGPCDE